MPGVADEEFKAESLIIALLVLLLGLLTMLVLELLFVVMLLLLSGCLKKSNELEE